MNRATGTLHMDGKKLLHLIRLFLIACVAGLIFFPMGWYMGKKHYEHQVLTALKGDNNIGKMLVEWQKSEDVTDNPVYFLAIAMRFLKAGDMESVKYNLDKIVDILGR